VTTTRVASASSDITKDDLSPGARRIYEYLVLMGGSTTTASAGSEISTVLQDPTMPNDAPIAVDINRSDSVRLNAQATTPIYQCLCSYVLWGVLMVQPIRWIETTPTSCYTRWATSTPDMICLLSLILCVQILLSLCLCIRLDTCENFRRCQQ
jgi:hypothetical protein